MNEHNHHRIIRRFVFENKNNKLPSNLFEIFIKASDFTDSIWDYLFNHFYYDIRISNNAIELKRVDENNNKSSYSVGRCDAPLIYEKDFFSFINDRPKSPRLDMFDVGNQSDNVAFLHAMGSKNNTVDGSKIIDKPTKSKELFVEHLKKCFAEYLFVEKEDNALYMLGIAMHGIMDSFTPSHMNFQHYTDQDMALHAQGDVIPIRCNELSFNGSKCYDFEDESVCFVPGQCNKASASEKWLLDFVIKGFDDNNYINDKEYEMLKIYLNISQLEKDNAPVDADNLLQIFKGKKLSEINNILVREKYKYSDRAYKYGEFAIKAMTNVYSYLSEQRLKIKKDYGTYKTNIKEISEEAVEKWNCIYDGREMKTLMNEHLSHDFYAKKKQY